MGVAPFARGVQKPTSFPRKMQKPTSFARKMQKPTVVPFARVQKLTRLSKQIRLLCESKTGPMKKQSNTNIVNSTQTATNICLILENQKEKLKTHLVQIEQYMNMITNNE